MGWRIVRDGRHDPVERMALVIIELATQLRGDFQIDGGAVGGAIVVEFRLRPCSRLKSARLWPWSSRLRASK